MAEKYLWPLLFVLITGCGGHKREIAVGPDTIGPIVTGVNTDFVSVGQARLTANALDNVGVSGYCFNTGSAPPTATDPCFQTSNRKDIGLTPSGQQRYYVWARDAAGNVSAIPTTGPCSLDGFDASDRSLLKTVCMVTSVGELVFELEDVKAPITVANFLKYVNDGFYSNTVFHRILSDLMVQGGGFNWTSATGFSGKPATYPPIEMELPSAKNLSNVSGTIAMARLDDGNSATSEDLNSATSQFFINVVDNSGAPNNFDSTNPYAVFGKVISGTTTLNSIKNVSVKSTGGEKPERSLPVNPPVILWAIQLK